jgi:outer membrane cobalamin receptor
MKVMSLGTTIWIIASVMTAALAIHVSEGGAGAEAQGGIAEELLLLKEETVSIAARHEQPISEALANVYVITDDEIRHSGAPDLPTVLRRIPGIEVIQMSGADST